MDNETILRGKLFDDKIERLKKVKVDGDNWLVYYIDETNGEKWVKEYPHSEYHGGGAPQLRLIDTFPWES